MVIKRTVTKAVFAKQIGVSRQRINAMISEGLPEESDGTIDRERGLTWVRKNIAASQKPASGTGRALVDIRCESELLKVELLKLELAEKSGELVPVAEMEQAWANVGQVFRDSLLSLPEKIAPQLAALMDARECRDLLKKTVGHILVNIPERINATRQPTRK